MGALIIKAVFDDTDDTYVIWSTKKRRPTHLLRTQHDLRDHLWAEHERDHPDVVVIENSPYAPDARIARALATGTSSITGQYGYDQHEWIVPARGGWAMLQRSDLVEFTHAVLGGNEELRQKLLTMVVWR